MATATAGSVTIDRGYFDTLIRKASLNSDSTSMAAALPLPGASHLAIVNKVDYENLKSIALQYANLRKALISGGVSADTVAVGHFHLPRPSIVSHVLHKGSSSSPNTIKASLLLYTISRFSLDATTQCGGTLFGIINDNSYGSLLKTERSTQRMETKIQPCMYGAYTDQVLSRGDGSAPVATADTTDYAPFKRENDDEGGVSLNPSTRSFNPSSQTYQSTQNDYGHGHGHNTKNESYHGGYGGKPTYPQQEWANDDYLEDNYSAYSIDAASPEMKNEATFNSIQPGQNLERPFYSRVCKRTVVLAGLPHGTTHGDITKVVRGGLVLEVYLRAAEHSALVSFLREEDAVRFYENARKYDLYINCKRVFIKWAERHFHLAGHVAGKIGMGATRNMIIRRCDPNHTEDSVRDDLEHIHNLIVIKVEFLGGSCYIKTNSVHNAMFARTCMMSRAKYKGSKIDWDVDECQQPLEVIQKTFITKPQAVSAKKTGGLQNRFASLRLDDEDDLESDDKFDNSSEYPAASTVDVLA